MSAMRNDHILDLLDRAPLATLRHDERARIEAHVGGCPACMRAYQAAAVSAGLLKARARVGFEPPPFFQARVMAAIRERQAALDGNALSAMWRAAGALVSAMTVAVLLLAALAFVIERKTQTVAPELNVGQTLYSPGGGLVGAAAPAGEDLSDEQVLTVIYDGEGVYDGEQ
jgi:hypothetical protein